MKGCEKGLSTLRDLHKRKQSQTNAPWQSAGQKRAENFLYEEELLAADDANDITHLHLAFSRDQRKKCYVQHKLEEAGEHIYSLIKDKSAHIYVCGDAKHMAHDVNNTFAKLAMEYGGQTEQQAVAWLKDLRRRKRYCEDVWS